MADLPDADVSDPPFPTGRLKPGLDRTLFTGVVLLVTVLFIGPSLFVEPYSQHTPWAGCTTDCPPNAFLVLDAEPAVMQSVVQPAREALAIALLLGVTGSLASRVRGATLLQRRTTGPVLGMSLVSIVILVAFLVARHATPGAPAVGALGTLWSLCVPGIAVAFFVGLLRRRLLVGEVLGHVSLKPGGRLDPQALQQALASSLGDPGFDVLTPDGAAGRWRDSEGQVTTASALAERGRDLTAIGDGHGAWAGLVHDPALRDDDELLEAVSSLMLAAVQHDRLEAELVESVHQLEGSRMRIAKAADLERSRIERDLHDGAQQRLVMLRIRLALAEELTRTDPDAAGAAMHKLGEEIDVAIEELRSLARGVYPSVLSDHGLEDALRSVVVASLVPIHLEAEGVRRHPPELETAIYFACVEAIQNATKHGPGTNRIDVSIRESHALCFEVRDDGPGFVVPSAERNGGLRNMRDRIEAVGGRLSIDSSPGRGTRVRGCVPLDRPPAQTLVARATATSCSSTR